MFCAILKAQQFLSNYLRGKASLKFDDVNHFRYKLDIRSKTYLYLNLRECRQSCRLKSPLSKDETRRDGSIPFIVILSLNHYSFCETTSQVLLS